MESPSKILGTFQVPVSFSLSSSQIQEALRLLNLHYLEDEICNEYDVSGRFVPKYPDKETEQFKDAVHRVTMSRQVDFTVAIDSNGQLIILA